MNRTPIKPPALKPGERIGIFAPSSAIKRADLDPGIAMLYARGFDVVVHEQTFLRDRSSAGTPERKIAAFYNLLALDDVRAVFAAKGGNHALDLLDRIDYGFVRKHPKILMGFSDTTAPLNAAFAAAGLVGVHGPTLTWLDRASDPDALFAMLAGKKIAFPTDKARILRPGTVTGPLLGGNLSLFSALIGTPFLPRLDGAILFLEDVGEEKSHLDRMFLRLRLSGVLDRIGGLVLGQFSELKDTGKTPYGFTLATMIERHFGTLKIPVLVNAPFGHGPGLHPIPVGSAGRLSLRGDRITFTMAEPAVST